MGTERIMPDAPGGAARERHTGECAYRSPEQHTVRMRTLLCSCLVTGHRGVWGPGLILIASADRCRLCTSSERGAPANKKRSTATGSAAAVSKAEATTASINEYPCSDDASVIIAISLEDDREFLQDTAYFFVAQAKNIRFDFFGTDGLF